MLMERPKKRSLILSVDYFKNGFIKMFPKPSSTGRLSNQLDRDLLALRDDILRLGDLTDKAILRSMRALKEVDVASATSIINDDSAINALRFNIEQKAYQVLAMQQPTARDMRAIITSIHIAVELERIADHAAGIAKLTLELANGYMFAPVIELTTMTQISREMLRASLDAYQAWDVELAHQTFRRDEEVDELHRKVYHKLVNTMMQEARNIHCATYLLWVSHNLERIADRITNICERVVFLVTGELMKEDDG